MNSQSTRSFPLAPGYAVALAGVLPLLMGASKPEEPPPQITYDAASMDTDFKTHAMTLKDVTITYGKMTVRADRALATAADFKNSRWKFDGNVRINAEAHGNLRSDQAVVEFEDNQLKRATATGNPAEFDQRREDSNFTARGHADEIVYEVGAGTVRLSNDAWVADGRSNDIRAPVIVYSLRDERVQASASPGTERVHVTVAPGETPGAGTNKSRPSPPDPGKSQSSPQSALPQTAAPQPPPTPQPPGATSPAPPGQAR
jgi:lipopolysaccharide transport protein LptA